MAIGQAFSKSDALEDAWRGFSKGHLHPKWADLASYGGWSAPKQLGLSAMRVGRLADVQSNRPATVSLQADDVDDLWNAYCLILPGDIIEASTLRRVTIDSGGGKKQNDRVRCTLCIKAETVDIDLSLTSAATIHIKGVNVRESEFVKIGGYHSLNISVDERFYLQKESWDSQSIERLRSFGSPRDKAEMAILLVQEGLANCWLLSRCCTLLLFRLCCNIPKKRRGFSGAAYDKSVRSFYEQLVESCAKNLPFAQLRVLVVGGPGFAPETFLRTAFATSEAIRNEKKRFVQVSTSGVHRHCIEEILGDKKLCSLIAGTQYAHETLLLDEFFSLLANDPNRAFYGLDEVAAAAELGAVSKLLIADSLFRSSSVDERKCCIQLVESVRKFGGKPFTISTASSTGERLLNVCGIAAITTFPIQP